LADGEKPVVSFFSFGRFARHKLGVARFCIVTALVRMALAAQVLMPCSPFQPDLFHPLEAPSSQHWLGTDSIGRDVVSRLVLGSRASLSVGLLAVAVYVAIGMALGAIAGYYGGPVRNRRVALVDGVDDTLSVDGHQHGLTHALVSKS
jgi:peptide/nickel transport system permease protein